MLQTINLYKVCSNISDGNAAVLQEVSQIFWVRISDEFGPWPGFQQNLQYQFCSYNHIQVNYPFNLSYMYFLTHSSLLLQ